MIDLAGLTHEELVRRICEEEETLHLEELYEECNRRIERLELARLIAENAMVRVNVASLLKELHNGT